MKNLCILIAIALLPACAHQNAGIRVYEPATETKADGSQRAVSRLVASISGDMPGLKDLTVGRVAMSFHTSVQGVEEEPVLNREGQLVAVRRTPILAGFFSSRTIAAQGKANRDTIDGVAAGVTGAVLSTGGAAFTGGVPGALGALAP
jgi:hypothetical protein